ncbi:MAG: carboxypeptidase-like regulatory domain-containing protein [Gemmataceae bacterium]|jgi:hypothetical protein|nr:carboxypeptidase-like regulatory domain-containing protein [Gemmataceae bacterium]
MYQIGFTITLLLGFSFVGGCQKSEVRPKLYPVTGKVTYNSSPVENATVVFHPIGDQGANPAKPRGKTDAQGNYKLTTYNADDGAPAGDYRVTVELWLAGRPDEGPSNRLPARYADPKSSDLKVTVNPSVKELPTLELKP